MTLDSALECVEVDTVIVGAGVIGLAVARGLSLKDTLGEVVVLERESHWGQHSSSRNSEVIHAGLYDPTHSEKATLCVQGRRLLYDYLKSRALPHRVTTKLVLATEIHQESALEALYNQGLANGVTGLSLLNRAEVLALEPAFRSTAALLSRETGIIDSHAYMRSLKREAESAGARLLFSAPVEQVVVIRGGHFLTLVGGPAPYLIKSLRWINCAGLWAQSLTNSSRRTGRLSGTPLPEPPPAIYAKGSYFSLRSPSPSQRLIYPLPEPGGLGVHLTVDLTGQARFGPNVEWIDEVEYSTDERLGPIFERSIRRYWPDLPADTLTPDYSGVRVKLVPKGQRSDFLIEGPEHHGIEGAVLLYGIESPGLTASLAIAERVVKLCALS